MNMVSLLNKIAVAAGIFALVLCVAIVINFIQVKRADPLNTGAMKVLVDQMHRNPADPVIREEIRQLDLLSRKTFFTNQWQVRMGGYLLFSSLLIIVICLKSIELKTAKLPAMPSEVRTDPWVTQSLGRKWVTYAGISVVILSFILVFLTHREFGGAQETAMSAASRVPDPTETTPKNEPGTDQPQQSRATDSVGKTDTLAGQPVQNPDGYPSAEENARNFPAFRGPGDIGIAFQKDIPTTWDGKSGKNIRWKTEVPLPGYNSPIIWGSKVFLCGASSTKREVYCFDLGTGKILWRHPVEKIDGSPSQEAKVNRETGFAAPTMTTDGRRVYAIFANGDLVALDRDGKRIWAKNLGMPQNHYGHSSSLIMYRDLLIVQYDQRNAASVMALKGKTGDVAWQTSRNVKISWASPALVNTGSRTELILAAEPNLISYNPADGKELWQIECISGEVGPSIAFAGGILFSVNDYSKLSAVKPGEKPQLLWENSEYLSDIPSPVATDKYLILSTSFGAVSCFDAIAGTHFWEHEIGTATYASPMIAEGRVYLLDKKGIMHIFKPGREFSLTGEPALGEGSSCTPAFSDGLIVIRGDKNLFCIGK
jgi:outer membrane protein assembly factor BamB